jgi:hypothetical protein
MYIFGTTDVRKRNDPVGIGSLPFMQQLLHIISRLWGPSQGATATSREQQYKHHQPALYCRSSTTTVDHSSSNNNLSSLLFIYRLITHNDKSTIELKTDNQSINQSIILYHAQFTNTTIIIGKGTNCYDVITSSIIVIIIIIISC